MIRRLARLPLCAVLLALTTLPLLRAADETPAAVRTSPACFAFGHRPIQVETFAPDDDARHPALVFLHALDGLETSHGPLYRRLARQYAAKGYVVLLVHYFDSTGPTEQDVQEYRTLFLPFLSLPPDAPEGKASHRLFAAWVEVACGAVRFARARPEV